MASTLQFNVFIAPEKPMAGDRPRALGEAKAWDPMTSTLIWGDREAVLVDPLTTEREAQALVAWVRLHNRDLTTVYVTHGHLDHFGGLSVILGAFPDARAIAAPGAVDLALSQSPAAYRKLLPGQMATSIAHPEPFQDASFEIEGHELRIIEQGRTDSPDSTSLHVPSLDLVVAGDVVYNQCHQFVAPLDDQAHQSWIDALDRLAALQPRTVIAGHKKPGAPDSPDSIEATKDYLDNFVRLRRQHDDDTELFNAMNELYPDHVARQSWLMFGLA